ncbi:MAG: methionine ABC transporter permease [Galactobacter sp.]|uniref:methionine ABC transporter permease n=1 Tax=Galactobacter sp. TaxID=2676125 RepID=UPI0025BF4EDE|nr:ABC transporter permease subunit [Galactobacter sp.]
MDWSFLVEQWGDSIEKTLYMVLITMVLGGILGLIIGLLLYATRPGNLLQNRVVFNVVNVIINIFRPIPFIIFIALMQPTAKALIGVTTGWQAALVPMTLMAGVVFGRLIEQNLVAVDPGVVEAARSMGAGRWRVLFGVVMPEALGPLILAYTFLFIGVVDMSAVAGYIGGGGLGDFAITYGYQQFDTKVTLLAVITIIVLVQLAQMLGNWLAKRVMRR